MTARMTPATFWAKADWAGDCLVWQGKPKPDGYGQVMWDYEQCYPHRVAWELCFGAIPDGLFVCHACDNRLCIKPSHLFLGTTQDNTRDRQSKGRGAMGEGHGCAKLNTDQVIMIKSGDLPTTDRRMICVMFGVNKATINNILAGRSWRHINVDQ